MLEREIEFSPEDVSRFPKLFGDTNPIHDEGGRQFVPADMVFIRALELYGIPKVGEVTEFLLNFMSLADDNLVFISATDPITEQFQLRANSMGTIQSRSPKLEGKYHVVTNVDQCDVSNFDIPGNYGTFIEIPRVAEDVLDVFPQGNEKLFGAICRISGLLWGEGPGTGFTGDYLKRLNLKTGKRPVGMFNAMSLANLGVQIEEAKGDFTSIEGRLLTPSITHFDSARPNSMRVTLDIPFLIEMKSLSAADSQLITNNRYLVTKSFTLTGLEKVDSKMEEVGPIHPSYSS